MGKLFSRQELDSMFEEKQHIEMIQDAINALASISQQIVKDSKATADDLCRAIDLFSKELALKYTSKTLVTVAPGDVVACNFGFRQFNEVSGAYVHALVCNVTDYGHVCVIPVTKNKFPYTEGRYLPMEANRDVFYEKAHFSGGTLLLHTATYISPQRIHQIVGKVEEDFLCYVLSRLAEAFDFTPAADFDMDDPIPEIDDFDVSLPEKQSEEEIQDVSLDSETQEKVATSEEALSEQQVSTKSPSFEHFFITHFKPIIDELSAEKLIPQEGAERLIKRLNIVDDYSLVQLALMHHRRANRPLTYASIIRAIEQHSSRPLPKKATLRLSRTWSAWKEQNRELMAPYSRVSFPAFLNLLRKHTSL